MRICGEKYPTCGPNTASGCPDFDAAADTSSALELDLGSEIRPPRPLGVPSTPLAASMTPETAPVTAPAAPVGSAGTGGVAPRRGGGRAGGGGAPPPPPPPPPGGRGGGGRGPPPAPPRGGPPAARGRRGCRGIQRWGRGPGRRRRRPVPGGWGRRDRGGGGSAGRVRWRGVPGAGNRRDRRRHAGE